MENIKNVIRLIKDELGGKILTKYNELSSKIYIKKNKVNVYSFKKERT